MKRTGSYILIHFLLSCHFCFAKDIEISGSFVLLKESFTYRYTSNSEASNSIQFTRNSDNKSTSERPFETFTIEVFKQIFTDEIKGFIPSYDATTQQRDVENKAAEIFFGISYRKEFYDDEPVTSNIIVKSDSISSFLSLNESLHYQGPLSNVIVQHKLKDIEVEFEQGTIKNMTLRLNNSTNPDLRNYLIFTNRFPFTISAKFDNESLSRMRLYCNNCGGVSDVTRFVNVGSFLILDNKNDSYKEDYSPVDGVIILNTQHASKELRKEKRSQIIEFSAFTDFMGVDSNRPNGLLQIEAARKISLWTQHFNNSTKLRDISSYIDFGKVSSYMPLIKKISETEGLYKITFLSSKDLSRGKHPSVVDSIRKSDGHTAKVSVDSIVRVIDSRLVDLAERRKKDFDVLIMDNPKSNIKRLEDLDSLDRIKFKDFFETDDKISGVYYIKTKKFSKTYFNYFGSLDSKFRFSKIEENEKDLELYNGASSVVDSLVPPLDFFRYQKISFTSELNLLKISFTRLKFNFLLNTGLGWYQTSARIRNEEPRNYNASNYNFNVGIRFFPDGRWGAALGYEYQQNFLLSESLRFANNSELLIWKFDGHLRTSATDKLFFRFRLTNQFGNSKNVFPQVQLGYSMNIFAVKPK